jgi:hypothetical protein
VADAYFDPIRWAVNKVTGADERRRTRLPLAPADGPSRKAVGPTFKPSGHD